MSVRSTSRCCCSRLCYYLCPDLAHAGETSLKIRNTFADILIKTAYSGLAVSIGLIGMQYFEFRKRPATLGDGVFAAIVTTIAVVSIAARYKLVKYTAQIDEILNVHELPFDEIQAKGLSHRLDTKTLSAKFVELAKGIRGRKFFEFIQTYDLQQLAASEIAPIAYCRFKTYGLFLKHVSDNELQYVFPLRSSAWTTTIPQKLEKEAAQQEKIYLQVKAISGQFPHRSFDLAEVFISCVRGGQDKGLVNVADGQQNGYIQALAQIKLS